MRLLPRAMRIAFSKWQRFTSLSISTNPLHCSNRLHQERCRPPASGFRFLVISGQVDISETEIFWINRRII